MDKHVIYGVHVHDRPAHVPPVQNIFTEYGCHIKTRIGMHEVGDHFCSPNGLILLEMYGDESKCREMKAKLNAIPGVEVQEMVFEHA